MNENLTHRVYELYLKVLLNFIGAKYVGTNVSPSSYYIALYKDFYSWRDKNSYWLICNDGHYKISKKQYTTLSLIYNFVNYDYNIDYGFLPNRATDRYIYLRKNLSYLINI